MLENLNLTGVYGLRLDEKTRIVVPSELREELSDKIQGDFYLLIAPYEKNEYSAIRVTPYPKEEYERKAEEMNRLQEPGCNKAMFFAQYRSKIDNQGRINITKFLADLMGFSLRSDVYVVGNGNYFEIVKLNRTEILEKIFGIKEKPK